MKRVLQVKLVQKVKQELQVIQVQAEQLVKKVLLVQADQLVKQARQALVVHLVKQVLQVQLVRLVIQVKQVRKVQFLTSFLMAVRLLPVMWLVQPLTQVVLDIQVLQVLLVLLMEPIYNYNSVAVTQQAGHL